MRARLAAVALVLAVAGAAGGCAAKSADGASKHGSSDKPSPAASKPMVTPTAPANTSLGAGERAWAAFSQRGLSQDAWWAKLKPLLSDSAQAVYVYDDPRNLPEMTLTGKIHVAAKAPDDPKYTAEVVIPTSKGTFALDLERHTVKAPYLLYAIKFPAGVH